MSKTTRMVLNRTLVHASVHGHAIAFTKGKPTSVPNVCVREIVAIGGARADGEDSVKETKSITPVDPTDRMGDIIKAADKIYEANQRGDFTGTGAPKVQSVSRETGFKVDKTELNKALKTRSEDIAAAKEAAAIEAKDADG